MEAHFIPDETEVISPKKHPYDGITFNVPLVHRYNTRARRLKGYNIMSNHVATIPPPIKMLAPAPTNTAVHITGEDWLHTNRTTGEVTIHPGIINAFVFPETGKSQDYRHLMKGPDKKMDKVHGR